MRLAALWIVVTAVAVLGFWHFVVPAIDSHSYDTTAVAAAIVAGIWATVNFFAAMLAFLYGYAPKFEWH